MLRIQTDPAKRFYYLLGGITLAGLMLRLNGLSQQSMTADEVDTIIRVKSSASVHELLDVWVRHDGHPPFTHLLEYFWTALFGFSPAAVRLPFALMGAGAIWFGGRTARKWFSEGAGIGVAAGIAFLQLPLMYSQLARPYAPGLFFTMATAWFWTQWLFGENRKRDLVFFVVCAAGAVYSHYFSLLMAGLMGGTGLLFLRGKPWKQYLLACICVLLLFLPYLGIFLFQVTAGGVGGPGGWLAKPTPAFFGNHIWFIFDESRPVLIGSLLIVLFSVVLFFKRPGKFHLLAVLFFATPLLIGYFYSVFRNPVLQNSVLLFSFPFLLMFLFSWLPDLGSKRQGDMLPVALALGMLLYVVVYKPFRLTDHFGRLKEIAEVSIEAEKEYGKGNVAYAFNVDYPYYMGYYWEQENYQPQQILETSNNGDTSLLTLRKKIESSTADYFVYGWSTRYSPVEIPEIIRETFPYLIRRDYWFNSAVYVFAKKAEGDYIRENGDILFESHNYFDPTDSSGYTVRVTDASGKTIPGAKWSEPCGQLQTDVRPIPADTDTSGRGDGPYTYMWQAPRNYWIRLDSSCVYSPSLELKAGDVLPGPDNHLLLSARIQLPDPKAVGVLVIVFERDGKQLYWNGRETITQADSSKANQWQTVFFGLQPPADLRKTDSIKVFFWSKDGSTILLDDLDFRVLAGHPGIYGERADYR